MKKFLSNVVEYFAALLVVALAVIVFIQVFNRYVLKSPLAWSEDMAMLLFQWVSFLGAAIGVKRMRHFGIELVVRRLPENMHRAVEMIVPLFIAVVAFVMITTGYELIQFNKSRVYASMNLTYTWTFLAIPVSGCLMIFYLIWQEITGWHKKKEGGLKK
jgi:TRAP-type C4-dicarboxylate transport system permease small subunit